MPTVDGNHNIVYSKLHCTNVAQILCNISLSFSLSHHINIHHLCQMCPFSPVCIGYYIFMLLPVIQASHKFFPKKTFSRKIFFLGHTFYFDYTHTSIDLPRKGVQNSLNLTYISSVIIYMCTFCVNRKEYHQGIHVQ
jgi:hypothetical protein